MSAAYAGREEKINLQQAEVKTKKLIAKETKIWHRQAVEQTEIAAVENLRLQELIICQQLMQEEEKINLQLAEIKTKKLIAKETKIWHNQAGIAAVENLRLQEGIMWKS